ncbi:bifunctional transaldolase/phosoglucose isomerase [Hymenobacter sp. J193]|uniref:bifunctional transaldolase/phosoglucose isomerase n=1 Tax=Hymenobacter sp. J193 TaxID=2898429 RepID=UPI0021513A04|nr:bifunctional transaldolase/phosoglucose isomerase [Hymenobacter sp. J193]MCR5886767.1 bifunctional transaldolase/phosoglucose isomerase [Hymenobacter sp. J193]
MNPLASVRQFNQSIWLDYIRRNILVNGELQRLLTEDGLRGVTSNPAIFEKAIGGSADYDASIQALALQGLSAEQIYEQLATEDVQHACDLLRPLYDQPDSQGDGYVSLEVSPALIHDTEGTVQEGLRFWQAVNRPNVMIKVPATLEGLPAIRQLIAQGVNVNVTLIFGLERYKAVAEAFLLGLENRAAAGQPLSRIDSVASFFLSRIDVLLDPQLEQLAAQGGEKGALAQSLVGEVALASAKQAYQLYKQIFSGPRWQALQAQGAAVQRLLWASTGNKNPKYDNLKYVEHLIGPETVNTIPVETLDLYRTGGRPQSRLEEGTEQAAQVLARLSELGIDLNQVSQQLEDEGGQKFNEPFAKLLTVLEQKRQQALQAPLVSAELHLGQYQAAVDAKVAELNAQNFTAGFWNKQADLWVEDATAQQSVRSFMGWLRVAETMVGAVPEIEQFVHEVKAAGFKHVVVMGMGGSSMTPIVFKQAFAGQANGLPLSVLDTTNPGSVREIEDAVPLAETLFVVASKSGTTAEPLAFGDYFYNRLREIKGERAGENFVAITDPGSKFVTQATQDGYRRIFLNFAEVGGRFSALSYFGLVPVALYGLPIGDILARAVRMMRACGAYGPVSHNPGLELGAALGVLAQHGRDKLTLVVPDSLSDLGLWLEQLIAESTGKEGKGVLPLAGEPLTSISSYGSDRVFVYVGYQGQSDAVNEQHLAALEAAGHPVVRILMEDARDLGSEFFRWEVATAVASAVLRINPFDQPNVQAAKTATDQLMKVVVEKGALPQTSEPVVRAQDAAYYTNVPGRNAEEVLQSFFGQTKPGDFLCIQAYLMETPALNEELQQVRALVQEQLHIATASGYGPRFLHSTGQYHKGGPDTGLYLQLTTDHAQDLPLPGRPYTFGTFQNAQAAGDLQALQDYNRRTLRIHFNGNPTQGVADLLAQLRTVLAK